MKEEVVEVEDDASFSTEELQAPMVATHGSGDNLTYEWRRKQLLTMQQMLTENMEAMRHALMQDLGREPCEAVVVEIQPVERDLQLALRELSEWMAPTPVPSPAVMIPAQSYLHRKPLPSPGVLIIGPFNYPFNLVFRALVGVLAAGNPAVLKPSEQCPNVSLCMKHMIDNYFEKGAVQVVLGSQRTTTKLLSKSWAKVMFTGSGRVGQLIAEQCVKTQTPLLLELGGKCPVIVDETVPTGQLDSVADRVVFGKFQNCGQTCIAPDTLFVHESHLSKLSNLLMAATKRQFGEDPLQGELARIVNVAQAQRVLELLKDTEQHCEKVLLGGSETCDVQNRYICPTIVLNPLPDARIMSEEIFGPVLPVVTFTSRVEAIQKVQALQGIPLELYVFTPSLEVFETYTNQCRSAAAFQNDCLVQAASSHMPLCGLGSSGNGGYFGKFSFDAFSHVFPVAHRPLGAMWDAGGLRYHPYQGWKHPLIEKYLLKLPDIPVLYPRRVLVGMTLLSLLLYGPKEVRLALAWALEYIAMALRER